MRFLILTAVLLTSCASIEVSGNTCSMAVAGDFDSRTAKSWLTPEILQEAMNGFIYSAIFSTDPNTMDQIETCKSLSKYRVYTKKDYIFDLNGQEVLGYTNCNLKIVVVGTPYDNNWRRSPLVHEMYHIAQNCNSPMPIDDRVDQLFTEDKDKEDHSNWIRANIFNAIDIANKE